MEANDQSQAPARLASVDALRFLAAIAVIWIHTAESPTGQTLIPFCRSAVPFFAASMIALSLKSCMKQNADRKWTKYAVQRFNRLYVPFLLWSMLYLLLRFVKHLMEPSGSPIWLGGASFFLGTTHHLWFLSFAFLMTLGVPPLAKSLKVSRIPAPILVALVSIMAIGVALTEPPVAMDPYGNPMSYWVRMSWSVLPSAIMGLPLALLPDNPKANWMQPASWTMAIALCLGLTLDGMNTLLANMAGCALCMAGLLQRDFPAAKLCKQLGGLSFGIYLVHLAIAQPLRAVRYHLTPCASFTTDALVWLASTLGSLLVVHYASRRPIFRFALPR